MEPVKFAVVGCGHIGKRHAQMIEENPCAQLAGLIDIKDPATLDLDRFGVPFFSSLEDFLASGIPADVITIATPNGLHAQHALQCLSAQKNVVIEKPIAITKADAERIIFSALNVHKYVFAVMQNRYSPPSAWIREMVGSGKLGKIFMVEMNCYWNRDARYYTKDTWHGTKVSDGGTLFTQFSHFIDILYWVFGDIENIRTRLRSFNHEGLTEFEDSGIVTFDIVSGGIGNINFSTSVWDKNMESSITVIAEHGSIRIGGQYMDRVDYCHVKNYEMPLLPKTNPGNDYGGYQGSAANHCYVIQNVIDVIHANTTITTNALEGLKVVDIIERIYAAAEK